MGEEGPATELLRDRPDLAGPLDAVLAVDRNHDTWGFEDVPVDSGVFGELVSSGVVESVGEEYRLADPEAVSAALAAEDSPSDAVETARLPGGGFSALTGYRPAIDRTSALLVAAGVAFVGAVRSLPVGAVYRGEHVVLSSNDPYFYRYWVERTVAAGSGVLDAGALAGLPGSVTRGEPLLVATLWWVAELFGGGTDVVGHVLAWYPVGSALVTALLVYWLAVTVSDDRRVGLAAVVLFAVVPAHAFRTSVGFADHHAFDYPWLAATGLGLARLLADAHPDLADPRTWLASAGLGVAIAGQTLAWEAAPLLLAPVGLVVAGAALVDVRADRAPVPGQVPVVVGLGLAALLALGAHAVLGWHAVEVAATPALLLAGSVAVLGVAAAVHRTTGDVGHLAGLDLAGAVVGLVAFRALLPGFWATLQGRVAGLLGGGNVAETFGLFSVRSFGFLFLLGSVLVVVLPAMAWGLRRAASDRAWLVASVYAWYFLALSALQVRFAGEFSPVAAVFGGVGLVWAAAWVDAADPFDGPVRRLTVPDRRQLGSLAVLFVLVTSLSAIQVPIKTSQTTIEDGTYESATFIADRSADLNQSPPDNYVFSAWGRNRVYNYFVSGDSRSYRYAQDNFQAFLAGDDLDAWYDRFGGRVGYVVVRTDRAADERTNYHALAAAYAGREDERPGSGHYRAIFRPPDGSRVVYAVVPGARLVVSAPANSTVSLATDVSVPGLSFAYERRTTAGPNGTASVVLAQPGPYTLTVDGERRTVAVSDRAVRNGTRVRA